MSSVDIAWLRMERPTNPMAITGVVIFAEPLELPRLKRALRERLLAFARFRQRPVQEAGAYHWELDPNFDLDRHVHRVALPRPGSKRELQELASDLASTPLDANQPMWQFHLVERYGKNGAALVFRIHHCYGDGVALMRVLLALAEEGAPPAAPEATGWPGVQAWLPWLEPLTDAGAKLLQWSGVFWQAYFEMLLRPGKAVEYAQRGAGMVWEAARLLSMAPEPAMRFRGKLGASKRVAWAEPLDLEDVRSVAKALDCSINDVLVATAAGALRSYLRSHGDPVEGLEIHAVVPVNLRQANDPETLGNRFGMVFLGLPLGIGNSLERVYAVHARMQALRHSPQPMLLLGLLGFAGMAPLAVHQQLLQIFGAHGSAVMTNVPGPPQRLRLAGAEIAQQMFWVPQAGEIGMGASIFSYAGQVQFGLITDAGLVPDPERIVERFRPEFEQLRKALPKGAPGASRARRRTPPGRRPPAKAIKAP